VKHKGKQPPIRIGLSAGPSPIKLTISAAASVDKATRTITGTITVFNKHSSSQGIKLMPGSLTPRNPIKRVKLLRDHDLAQPVGYMTTYTPGTDSTTAAFKVAEGADGDKALDDAEQGLRDGFSVGFIANKYEFDDEFNLIVHEAELFEVSLVAVPDFQDAQVESVALSAAKKKANPMRFTAEQIAALKAQGLTDAQIATLQAAPETPAAPTPLEAQALGGQQQQPAAPAAQPQAPAPQQLAADQFPQAGSVHVKERPKSLRQVALQVSAAVATGDPVQIQLALQDVLPADDLGEGWGLREGWMGEVWQAANSGRKWISALGPVKPLTTMELKGWAWDVRPKVQKYSGNKTDVPSNKPKTKPITGSAERWAGGWDIDRIFFDLGNADFLTSFWTAAAAEYDVDSDTDIATKMLLAATDKGYSPDVLAAIGAVATDLRQIGATVNQIFLAEDLFETYGNLKSADVPFWLANATGVSLAKAEATVADLKIEADNQLDDGTIVAFDKRAADVHEKTPIKLQAQDIAKGGVDLGFFSYGGLVVNDPRAIVVRTVGVDPTP
jgi:HK97 family phage prohead protease